MRLAIATLGSAGDLYPYLAIARAMQQRGHEVHFLSQAPHRQAVEAEGVAFTAIASEQDQQRTLQHPGLWHPIGGFGVLWRHLCVPAIQPTFDTLQQLVRRGDEPLTVLASPLAVGARFAREALPIQLLTGYTAPSVLRSCADPLFLGAWQVPAWLPHVARHWLWRGLDAWKLEPMVRRKFASLRSTWDLGAQQGSTFGEWIHSPDGGVTLFPRWFADAAADWPLTPFFGGFPVFEPRLAQEEDGTALAAFLAEGEAPLVVNAGSASFGARGFLERAMQAGLAQGYRCVLICPYPEQWPSVMPEQVLAMPSTRLSTLLPQAAGLVHHGGIGTCSQALAAGVPQIVLPSAYDQFDNGHRVAQGGWGVSVAHHAEHPSRIAEAVAWLRSPVAPRQARAAGSASATAMVPPLRPSFFHQPNEAVQRICAHLTGDHSASMAEGSFPGDPGANRP